MRFLILVAPSGAGKTYFSNYLNVGDQYKEVVSTTTREMRAGEVSGVDYHFISKSEFKKKIEANQFLEFINTKADAQGDYYGTSIAAVEAVFNAGQSIVHVVEPVGAINLYNHALELGWMPAILFINVNIDLALERFVDRYFSKSSASAEEYADRIAQLLLWESDWINYIPYTVYSDKSETEEDLKKMEVKADAYFESYRKIADRRINAVKLSLKKGFFDKPVDKIHALKQFIIEEFESIDANSFKTKEIVKSIKAKREALSGNEKEKILLAYGLDM